MKTNQGKLGSSPSSISAKVTTRAGAFKNSGKIGDLGNKGGSPANTRLGAGGGAFPTVKFGGKLGAINQGKSTGAAPTVKFKGGIGGVRGNSGAINRGASNIKNTGAVGKGGIGGVRGNSGAINRGKSSIKSGGRVGGGGLGKKGKSYGKSRNKKRSKRTPVHKTIKEGVTLNGHARLVVKQEFDFQGKMITLEPTVWEAEINGQRWEGENWFSEMDYVLLPSENYSITYSNGVTALQNTTQTKRIHEFYGGINVLENAAWAMNHPNSGKIIYRKEIKTSRTVGGTEAKFSVDLARAGRYYEVERFKLSR